ncbi:MAG: hypothetical protein FRX49_00319 [Trebouxia sp. A1-2]|nr:MAG: hypothetical protein FRX49_00319 [Trebouxia sp. A1-2]
MQAASRSCSCVLRAFSQAAAGSSESSRHSITTSAAAGQKQNDAATCEDWQSLTRGQKKQALKPEKNRNHFKRMWKKDLQIKHAHQARKRQQAAADAQRHKFLQEKWRAGASMWQSTSKTADVTASQ